MVFQPGNTYGKGGARRGAGRKPKEAHALLRHILGKVISDQDWEDICLSVLGFAKSGSIPHCQLLMAYKFGKPVERQEISGPDGGPVEFAAADAEDAILIAGDRIRARRERVSESSG